jgi:hypothetical protein
MGLLHARGWAGYICAGGLVKYARVGWLYADGLVILRGDIYAGLVQIGKILPFFSIRKNLRSLQGGWG